MTKDQLLDSVNDAHRAFREFVAQKREIKSSIHGQTIGQEAYRLDFIGDDEAKVHDALIKLWQEVGQLED